MPRCHATPPEKIWTSFDGTRFPYAANLPADGAKPRAIVILVPGWDAVTSDYVFLIDHLVRSGYAVYGSENRTQVYDPVRSRHGNPEDWRDWVRDLQAFTQLVERKHPGVPVFYHGHGFGAIVAMQAAAESRAAGSPRGIIAHSPGFPLMSADGKAFSSLLMRSVAWVRLPHVMLFDLTGRLPTADDVFNARWLHSPDRLPEGYKVRFLIMAARLGHEARLSSRHLELPVLALEGARDPVVARNDRERCAYHAYLDDELAGGRATLKRYANGSHTVIVGETREQALDDITTWLDHHVR